MVANLNIRPSLLFDVHYYGGNAGCEQTRILDELYGALIGLYGITVDNEAGAPENDSSLGASNPSKVTITSPAGSLGPCSVSPSTIRARI